MHSLKTVAEKVKRSPQVIRKKITKQYDNLNHHQELREDWLHEPEPLLDGVPFYVKWLGSCQVFKAQGIGCTDEAVKQIVENTKKIKKTKEESHLQKVLLTVTTKRVTIEDMITKVSLMEIPIYRISYCTADPNYPKIFAFISREPKSKVLNCHAMLCSKESMAQAISLTVADAFSTAYESYEEANQVKMTQVLHEISPEKEQKSSEKEKPISLLSLSQSSSMSNETKSQDPTLEKNPSFETESLLKNNNSLLPDSGNPFQKVDFSSSSTNPFSQAKMSGYSCDDNGRSQPCIKVTGDEFLGALSSGSVNESASRMKALDLAVDDFDNEFTQLAKSRSSSNLFETPVRRSDFHDDVKTLMANERTAMDLMKSHSHEDLLM
ncbi:low density lipoprotein receptor adapter protein 1-B-like [Actinia tenebrosa]|uniref:Low density lipoprotein receptor adapter protein 1-B-like n=1 Tax=Actinia tenebrosa TaxID=6105 RepID=A0A6P8HNE2_ACTTE|nr:low density lipoprotein receptor adapter protein 1-B-like [Actinia tenebrosa]